MARKSAADTSVVSELSTDLTRLPPRAHRTYVWVTFSQGDKNADKTAFAGLNGEFFNYPRGKRCLVPKDVLEGCFAPAIQVNIETHDDNTRSESEEAAFPYQTHGEATPEQVAEYFAKDHVFKA